MLQTSQRADARGDAPDHLLALYAAHAQDARALAARLLYDPHEAEDVLQDVFVTLWRRPDAFDPQRGTGRAWLLTAVRHRSMDYLRKRVPRTHLAEVAEQVPDPAVRDIADELDAAVLGRQLWQLVDSLPQAQADLIRRAYLQGQTHQEIAELTGLPLGTVKSRIRLGLDKLRCALTAP